MLREARREGGVRLLCNPIDGAQDQEMERARVTHGEGLVSVQGQENILKWVGGTVTQCCDP